MSSTFHQRVSDYYTGKLAAHGVTPQGVDWNSVESQALRFKQLLRLHEGLSGAFSLNDYGCGYGALANYLQERGYDCDYLGYDIAPAMVDAARQLFADVPKRRFTAALEEVKPADYTVASGIFNVKLDAESEPWLEYILQTIDAMWEVSSAGMAFNSLTSYSDAERMRADLYYASPTFLFDYCKKRFSRHVALLHDYGLYEFTILVRRTA